MYEHLVRLLCAAILAILIKGSVALFGHSIAWWVAALIALVAVYGGFLILDPDRGWGE